MAAIVQRRTLRPMRSFGSSLEEAHNRRWMASVALEALDQLATGVIVTDNGAAVLEMNRAGGAIVRLGDGLLIRNDRLCARRVFETAKVARLIAGATAEGKPGTAGRMLIGRSDGLPAYVLTVAPLRTGLLADERRLAMIIVVDPVRQAPSETDLAEFFGLSPAEARVAAALLTGKTLAEIAAVLGIRITTVRTQFASILRKVGAERQADLVRILSSAGIGSMSFSAAWFNIAETITQMPLWLCGA